jgi:hypothetical protein
MALTFSQAAATLTLLPVLTQEVIVQMNANYDSNWTGYADSYGAVLNDTVNTIAPFLGPNPNDAALRFSIYLALVYLTAECHRIIGLSPPAQIQYY